jgi:putative DNA primase/helicase
MTDQAQIEQMRQRIDEARRLEEDILGVEKEYEQEDAAGISPAFVAECYRLNERGDGMLFARIFKNRFVYVKKVNMWLYWVGNHWKYDEEDRVIDAVDTVAQYYEEHADRIRQMMHDLKKDGDREGTKVLQQVIKNYSARVKKLRSLKGVNTCVDYSHRIGDASLKIFPEALDKKPTLMAFKNCVVDMLMGEIVPSNPEDYIVNAVDHDWQGVHCPCPRWDAFFAEIHQHDPELIAFVHRLLGYSATGLRTEHFIACFIGRGRNGKGTMFDTLRALLGDLAWIIDPGMLLEQKNQRKSAGPSPDLYSLIGRRMVIASETDEGARISISETKRLTGGDWIKTRAPHDRTEINFRPSHKLLFHTNSAPHGLAKDYAMAKRLLYIDYLLSFVDNPNGTNERQKDPDLAETLEAEASGILAWLIRGAMAWRAEGGLNPPDKIRAAVDARRLADDTVLSFFGDMIDRGDKDIYLDFGPLYDKYIGWYKDNIGRSDDTRYAVSKIKFSKWLNENDCRTEKVGGKAKVYGITFKPIG